MSRPLRLEFDGALYHIFTRGHKKESIFHNNRDREKFLEKVVEAVNKHKIFMHHINTNYCNWFKARHQIIGSVFQGRYKSILIEKESYLLTLSAYIHLNPLRAGIVKDLSDYKWSSYMYYIGEKKQPEWLYSKDILISFSNNKNSYQQFVLDWYKKNPESSKLFYGKNSFLGSQSYLKSILKKVENNKLVEDVREIPDMKNLNLISANQIKSYILDEFNIEESSLHIKRSKSGEYRKLYVYALRQFSPLKLREIGTLVGLDYSAISIMCKRFEDSFRTNSKNKAIFNQLEGRIKTGI